MFQKRLSFAALAALTLVSTLVLGASPAAARKVANPASNYVLKVQSGFLRMRDYDANFDDENRAPMCSDGQNAGDEEQDGGPSGIDYPADAQCSSPDDDSEVAAGFQPKLPVQLTAGTIDSAGTITFPTSGISFPPGYVYVPANDFTSAFVMTVNVYPTQNFTGHINPITGAMDLAMHIRIVVSGNSLLGSGCGVNPINLTMTSGTTGPRPATAPATWAPISGTPYNPSTGRVLLVDNTFSIPGASNCGWFGSLNGTVNSELGLPSDPGNNEAQMTMEFIGTRPQPGVTASFTTTPSSGPAALNVGFNGAASTGTGLVYQWDFTNDGGFDASGSTASYTYNTPGLYTARLRVTDTGTGGGDYAETTRQISVGANLPPVANGQIVSTDEDTPVGITLSGSDPELGPLTYALSGAAPAHGTLSGTAPNLIYTPAANFNESDSFGFKVTDNYGNTATGTVRVDVTPVNDPPRATNVSAATDEDTPTDVTLVGSDVDGDTLTYSIVGAPTKGTLTAGTGAGRTYTPNANVTGVDTFTYTVTDPSGAVSNVATGTVTIAAINDAPVATPQSITVPEDGAVNITLGATDVDSTGLGFALTSTPPAAHGTVTGTLPNLVYKPAANYAGPDTIGFRVTDPTGAFDTATVSITVTPVNDPPTTSDEEAGTQEGQAVVVSITGNDVEGDALTYTPSPSSANGGTVSCTGNACTYTPASGFSGIDTFTVTVGDGHGGTAVSTVTVEVAAVNNALPTLADATYPVVEDTPKDFTLAGRDADNDPLTYTVTQQPTAGVVTCSSAGACRYVPAANDNGNRTFKVRVSDGRGGRAEAVMTLAIAAVNDAPVPSPKTDITAEDTPVVVEVSATDVDGDALTWTLKQGAAHGTVSCASAGSCRYTPAANYNGPDSFVAEVSDGRGGTAPLTVNLTVTPVNDAPDAATVPVTILEDSGAVGVTLLGTDVDGPYPLRYVPGTAKLGTFACSGTACTYTPFANANGIDTIGYTVDDGSGPVTGAVVITITAVNDRPTAPNLLVSTREDTPVTFTLPGTDVDDDDVLAFAVTGAPPSGYLSGTVPTLTYTPAPNASGVVSFTYSATDRAGASSSGTVTITVLAADDPPTAVSRSVVIPEDGSIAVALAGSDTEGPVTITILSGPGHGTYSGGVYRPAVNYNGPDSIRFRVTDTPVDPSKPPQTADGLISITVTAVNDAPVATNKSITTPKTVPVAVALPVSDPDGDVLTYAVTANPTHGTLSGTAPNLTYTPTGTYTGADAFTFRATDPAGLPSSATVSITVTPGNVITQVVVSPARVIRNTNGTYTYSNLTATLKSLNGMLLPNMTLSFIVNGSTICSGSTNSSGVATCTRTNSVAPAATYTVKYAGTSGYSASSGTGGLSS